MIRNLLFDLGGVVLDIKRQRCVDAFKRLGMERPEEFLGEYVQKGPFMMLESGLVSPAEFRDMLRPYISRPVSDQEIDDAFNAFLIGIPRERLRHLEALRKDFGIYLLSNTNPIMWESKIADCFRVDGREREDYFDGMVTSFEARVMKPDARIFEYAEQKLGIRPEETIFFDDSEANCRAAEALGFKTIHVPAGADFYTLLKELSWK